MSAWLWTLLSSQKFDQGSLRMLVSFYVWHTMRCPGSSLAVSNSNMTVIPGLNQETLQCPFGIREGRRHEAAD